MLEFIEHLKKNINGTQRVRMFLGDKYINEEQITKITSKGTEFSEDEVNIDFVCTELFSENKKYIQ
jgi:hypothetical protein